METITKQTDYEIALAAVKELPKFFIGQEVDTQFGKGIIVSLMISHNGLYLSPENSTAVIWFGAQSSTGWSKKEIWLDELAKEPNPCQP